MSVSKIREDLGSLQSMFTEITTLSSRIGTSADTAALRSDLQGLVSRLSSLAQTTKGNIETLIRSENPDVGSLQQSFSEISAQMKERLPGVIQALRGPTSSSSSRSSDIPRQQLMDQQLLDRQSEDLDVLEQQVQEILRTMREVNALFTQTLQKIQEQRHLLVGMDQSTSESIASMTAGNESLEKAAGNQKRTTKCMCWIFLIVGVILGGIILFLVLYLGKK
jgi:chromosome segregation ATPase